MFRSCAQLVELVCVALVGFGSEGVARREVLTMPCRHVRGTARACSPSAGNVGLALGVLGSQVTGPEHGDRAALTAVWLGVVVGSWSGGASKAIGEAGRPGVLSRPRSLTVRSGRHRHGREREW
jgi:hypothetical protein